MLTSLLLGVCVTAAIALLIYMYLCIKEAQTINFVCSFVLLSVMIGLQFYCIYKIFPAHINFFVHETDTHHDSCHLPLRHVSHSCYRYVL